ncbi:MAG: ABC transporter substrate-binding protein [Lachnospiraceae bacterium]|jgi:ABC-type nitrate/sulfonate/bicarbonate transport system substrate-binding protein|nr:ABC transporter substrate-binding protein [Lachnospiraceae bacterium]MCI9383623.1 ABC transporter substrate-binding protein [Lachnospiraceae bacterium]
MKQKRALLLCMIYTFAIILSCCKTKAFKEKESDISETEELLPIRVAVQEYYISSPIGYIKEHQLDRKFGLELEPVLYPSGAEQILDIEEDVYDVATIGTAFLYPLAEGQAVLIGEHMKCTGGNSVYVRKDSPILDVRGFNPIYPQVYGDLETVRDSTILMKENTTSQYLGMKWLESIGVKAEAVHIEYMDFDEIYESFSGSYGDVAVLTAPFSYQAEKDGYVQVASITSLSSDMYEVVIAARQAYETKKEALVRFLQLLLYANEEMEKVFEDKVEACKRWYEENGVEFTMDILKKECRDKPFVTAGNYDIEEFGKFEYKYAEYMAAIGNIPPIRLKNVKEHMDAELFREALERNRKNPV